jgi:acetyltransferase-like isoleucine patch superfamily enzyme
MKPINYFLKFFGNGFANPNFSILLRIKCIFFQKVLGFNRNVPWPVHWTSKVSMASKIDPGTRCPGLSMGCHIDGRNGIQFGSNVWVGPRVSIISMNHDVNNYHQYEKAAAIKIGDHCWLAANSVILPGVELGEHTIVAAGCVVNKSFPDGNQVLAGVPAKVVKKLDSYNCE